MGGAAGINVLFGMLRTKFAATLIGPAGVGLLVNLTTIQTLVTTVAGLGIQSSAVQGFANAEQDNGWTIALSVSRVCLIAGLVGAVITATFSHTLSLWMFNSAVYSSEIAWLSVTVFFIVLSGGKLAAIQGARRIGDLARSSIITAGSSALVAFGFYSWLGVGGILPSLIVISVVQWTVSWLYSRHIFDQGTKITWMESILKVRGMVQLGVSLMWSALMTSLVSYFTNALITYHIGLTAVGINSAAFSLSGIFVGFVLNAMGTDYYPRLSSLTPDKVALNSLVNEQTEIGLLLSLPGILAIISLAPWVIHIFYSAEFLSAVSLLQWFVLGCLIRVVQWPMGFLQLVTLKGRWFLMTQTFLNAVHLLLIWAGIKLFGIEGVSMAFFCLYTISLGVVYMVATHLTGFKWSLSCRKLLIIFVPVVAMVFIAARLLPLWPSTIIGIVASLISSLGCLRGLVNRIGGDHRIIQAVCRIPGMGIICGIKTG